MVNRTQTAKFSSSNLQHPVERKLLSSEITTKPNYKLRLFVRQIAVFCCTEWMNVKDDFTFVHLFDVEMKWQIPQVNNTTKPITILAIQTRKAHKWWDQSHWCATQFILTGNHNAHPLNIWVQLQLLCAQRGKDIGFSWQVRVIASK